MATCPECISHIEDDDFVCLVCHDNALAAYKKFVEFIAEGIDAADISAPELRGIIRQAKELLNPPNKNTSPHP